MSDPRQEQIASAPDRSLIDRERIRGASRMIPEGTEASAVTPDQIEAVAADVMLFTNQWRIPSRTWPRPPATPLRRHGVLQGDLPGNLAQVAIDLDGWLREEEQRRRKRPETTRFVRPTSTRR
jgi:hypothetical protein